MRAYAKTRMISIPLFSKQIVEEQKGRKRCDEQAGKDESERQEKYGDDNRFLCICPQYASSPHHPTMMREVERGRIC